MCFIKMKKKCKNQNIHDWYYESKNTQHLCTLYHSKGLESLTLVKVAWTCYRNVAIALASNISATPNRTKSKQKEEMSKKSIREAEVKDC